jgi:hypothetical protein
MPSTIIKAVTEEPFVFQNRYMMHSLNPVTDAISRIERRAL